ncbi:DNA polymerase III subunit alpha [Flavobacterium sp. Fl-77]|uniref:DNA polymerase III subunit alpha n=1 Tax=Flavobacterium flavipigmentatum TaxID=2893884 RepID=A0AAJ2SG21_9FLAO|nr:MULTISPECIES: DNA polymerase III subunit alpha [unclassified Flavobacterium]MDX6183047.1 DNA polymerase III subunit alpha [Flavobacterium sp. Fl-33]MDX6186500.1 DNA polymerase III subunit alpha [Flavobacterium sp. Fl-77]UFH37717.1 DNA polymerase III subunit alpha [Flavobacterium sp. F-70]
MYLNCHSFHSLRYGTIPLEDLITKATACDVTAMALTDINTVTGIYDFIKGCEAAGIKPLVGMEFRSEHKLRYIGLAKNASGLAEMNRFLTRHNFEKTVLPAFAPEFENVFVIYSLENAPDILKRNEYIGIGPQQLQKLVLSEWKTRQDKMVILQPVTFRSKREYNLHRILRAIDMNVILSRLTPDDYCRDSEVMVPMETLLSCYVEYPQITANTEKIIQECHFEFDFKTPKNKKFYTNNRKDDINLLTTLAQQGLEWRYGKNNAEAKSRMFKELKVIDQLEFSGYFLITWDIIRFSNSQGFLHIGRGSGANSIIAYCLGITDICPLELDLYFERFLNLNRKSPPDFDIDWSWKERDTILEYIFSRYGYEHVAFCGTNVEFKYRSIFREVGKVFGLPKEELDALAKNPMELHATNKVVKQVQQYGMLLEKYPNQRSMHSCGILISEEPITNYTPLEMPPKGFPIVLFDMHIAEDIGLEKFDILSQRGIGHIDDSVKLIEKNRGIRLNIRDTSISKNEASCNAFLAIGRTIGCFYIESLAMRGLLRRLNCDNYKTLVAASSIIRPGVAQSGMMKEYIFRHNHPDKFEYFHPVFQEQLGETYGIMVYQEDVIKIALHYGGLPAADGDILRRAMSGKGRSKEALQKVKDNFFASCHEQGHPLKLSEEIYRQIESFAGYSFCKAHSASYAVESYQSLYLKVHYPVEFMVAVINNQGGFYRTEVYVHEARMSGATIHNPCVNKSEQQTTLYGTDVYLGFMHLQSLESKIALLIQTEREQNGDYKSLEDFINRIPIGIEGIQILIFIGAFRFTKKTKNQLLVIARLILVNFKPENRSLMLIQEPVKEYELPKLERSQFEDAFDEIELLSFPVSCSPFALLQTRFRGDVMAKDLFGHHKKTVRMLAYLISRKHVPTKMGAMYFGTWIDAQGEMFDTAHFTDSLAKYPFQGGGCYLLLGHVEVDYHFPTITVTKMAKMPFIADPRYSNSDERQFKVHGQLREDVSMTQRQPYPQEHEINLPRIKMGN